MVNPWIFCIWLAYLIDGRPEIRPKYDPPFPLVKVGISGGLNLLAMRDNQQVPKVK